MITARTKLNAVIGYPLTHSLSPTLHSRAYELLGIDAVFLAFESKDIVSLASAIKTLPIHLCSVTMPHKETIMQYLDRVDDEARAVGAINTIVNRNGSLEGYNTDIVGIRETFAAIPLRDKKVLICGAGGAAHAAAYVFSSGGADVSVTSRDPERTNNLTKKFGVHALPFSEVSRAHPDIIVNATPVGMHPLTAKTPLSGYQFRKEQIVFDCIYNPPRTRLLTEARASGALVLSGLDMFLNQALAQIALWTGETVSKNMKSKLKNLLLDRLHI